jgi:hypothetical protein
VQASARNGVRIVETRQLLADRAPVDVALDRSAPLPARLRGIELFEVRRADATSREQIVAPAGDDDSRVARGTGQAAGRRLPARRRVRPPAIFRCWVRQWRTASRWSRGGVSGRLEAVSASRVAP